MAVEYDNDFDQMEMTCDSCGYSETFDGSWNGCIEQAKMAGWRMKKTGGDWEHYCNTCVELGEAGRVRLGTIVYWAFISAMLMISLWSAIAYYTWPCAKLKSNPVMQYGYTPSRCIK